jgi:curved DNA-binding protein CbpA
MLNYYRILRIDRDADPETMRSAYRARARETHPDTGNSKDGEDFGEVKEAYDVLSDEERRQDYHTEYEEYAVEHGLVVCSRCYAMVRVPAFKGNRKPKCGQCKTPLKITPRERDQLFGRAFSMQVDNFVEALGVEGAALATDAVRALSNKIRRRLGIRRSEE